MTKKQSGFTSIIYAFAVVASVVTVTTPTASARVTSQRKRVESSNVNLKSIRGINLNESFDKERLEYTATVDADVESLNFTAEAEDPYAEVYIDGGDYLRPGANTVRISVIARDYTQKTYTIKLEENQSTIDELILEAGYVLA